MLPLPLLLGVAINLENLTFVEVKNQVQRVTIVTIPLTYFGVMTPPRIMMVGRVIIAIPARVVQAVAVTSVVVVAVILEVVMLAFKDVYSVKKR